MSWIWNRLERTEFRFLFKTVRFLGYAEGIVVSTALAENHSCHAGVILV
jgi:hypothetical protein